MKKIICFFFVGWVLLSLPACFSSNGELVGNQTTRLNYDIVDPYGMREIPAGSFTMGGPSSQIGHGHFPNSSQKALR